MSTFKEVRVPTTYKFFLKIEEETPGLLYEATEILESKPDRDITKYNYGSIPLMNINTKIINKILVNRIQKNTKKDSIL